MPRSLLLLTLLTACSLSTFAQAPAGKPKTEEPAASPVRTYLEPADTAIEKRLVALALASPTFDASNHQNKINELELRRAKSAWLNLLTVSTSYYDQSGNKSTGTTTYVVPKYYFSLSIPLGIIFSQGNQIKTAREGVAMSKDRQDELARTIKADILTKYKQYRLYTSLLDMESEMINDVMATSSQVENNFKKGLVTVDVYISSQKTRNDELAKLMNLKLQQDLIKLDIEKMIGIPLDQVLRTGTKK